MVLVTASGSRGKFNRLIGRSRRAPHVGLWERRPGRSKMGAVAILMIRACQRANAQNSAAERRPYWSQNRELALSASGVG